MTRWGPVLRVIRLAPAVFAVAILVGPPGVVGVRPARGPLRAPRRTRLVASLCATRPDRPPPPVRGAGARDAHPACRRPAPARANPCCRPSVADARRRVTCELRDTHGAQPRQRSRALLPRRAGRADGHTAARPASPEGLDLRERPRRPLVIVGVMFSVRRDERGPSPGGPITRRHSHLVCTVGERRGVAQRQDGSCPLGARLRQGSEMSTSGSRGTCGAPSRSAPPSASSAGTASSPMRRAATSTGSTGCDQRVTSLAARLASVASPLDAPPSVGEWTPHTASQRDGGSPSSPSGSSSPRSPPGRSGTARGSTMSSS